MLLIIALMAGGTPATPVKPDDDCYTVWGGTGGRHPISEVCPERQKQLVETIRIMAENGSKVGVKCANGMAYLRNGGRLNRLEDYYCNDLVSPQK
ncbi:hypothetical protein [Novosphingobium sp. AP12]|uniref:hypothetical protein n=1 Tax=Novosphingobium sp. AP12 TaxID=1144305 RepID=UPI0012FCDB65|nr:hypothetical protein [Novosphingobium sp. AP12]